MELEDVTSDTILTTFDGGTYERGREYFEFDHIEAAVRFDDRLWGTVTGRCAPLYRVNVRVTGGTNGGLDSNCTCPVGIGCKHAAALALCWVEAPERFLDASALLRTLEAMPKSELLALVERALEAHPPLVGRMEGLLQTAGAVTGTTNMSNEVIEEINRKIAQAISGRLDFYHVDEASDKLERIEELADERMRGGEWKLAAEIYLQLFGACQDALDIGADDSCGRLGSLADEFVDRFLAAMNEVGDRAFKDRTLETVLALYEGDDYGLEPQRLFVGVVTEENIGTIKRELYRIADDYRARYGSFASSWADHKRAELDQTLIDLYTTLGRFEDALAQVRSTLTGMDRDLRLADLLARAGRYEAAFEKLRSIPQTNGAMDTRRVASMYFDIVGTMREQCDDDASEWGVLVDLDDAITYASVLVGTLPWHHRSRNDRVVFNEEAYEEMNAFFERIGAGERFRSGLKEHLSGTSALVELLLVEDELHAAIDTIRGLERCDPALAMQLATRAGEEGMPDTAMELTGLALRSEHLKFCSVTTGSEEWRLIRAYLENAPREDIESLIPSLAVDRSLILPLIELLIAPYPAIARAVVDRVRSSFDAKTRLRVADALASIYPEYARGLMEAWIDEHVTRHYTYYDRVVDMMKVVKRTFFADDDEEGWRQYIAAFRSMHQTRRKLQQLLSDAGLE